VSQQESAFLEAAGGLTYPLKPEKNVLGRAGGDASIEIRDKSLSRAHAEVTWDGSGWTIRDLNSRNKTFLNEKPLPPEEPAKLSDGDQVHLGAYALHFRLGTTDAKHDIDATMPLDVSSLPFDDMFIKAGMKSKAPDGPGGGGGERATRGTPVAGVSTGEAALAEAAFAYLELRSVTRPTKYYLTKKSVRIGSDATSGCDIIIPENGIEGTHIEIKFMGGKKIRLRNLASSGTLVNGKRSGNIPLNDGDTIDLGDASFTFRVLRLPDGDKASSGLNPALLVIGILLLLVVGGGGYWYKVNFMDAKEAGSQTTQNQQSATSTPAPQTASISIQRALDEIRRLEFVPASQTAATIANESTDPATKRRAQTIKEHLDMLLMAQAQVKNRMYLDARAKLAGIPEGDVRDLAGEDIRRLDMECTQFINNTIAQIRDAEARERWSDALGHLDALRGNAEGLTINPSKVRERIELKRRASEEIQLAARSPLIDQYELTAQRVKNLLADIERKAEAEPSLNEDLAQYVQGLRNLAAHAELIGEYLQYKGGALDRIREIDARIHPGYPQIRDVRSIVSKAERIQRLQDAYGRMLEQLEANPAGPDSVSLQQQLIQNRQDVLVLEESPKFQLATEVRTDLRRLQDFRKEMIVAKWKDAPRSVVTEDKEQLLSSHVAMRQHAFEVLSLFEPEVRRRIQSRPDIVLHIAEPELQAVYGEALEEYGSSFMRATAVLYESIVDPNPTFDRIRQDSQRLSTTLRESTLPEDENSRRQLDRLREEQLRARSRS
jgi:pSer/pThr/pTyr-binding forkhead associated (FHA) protein